MAYIKERLLQSLKYLQITVGELEKMCQFSNRYFSNVNYNVPDYRIDTICKALPIINRDWLLGGDGEMIKRQRDIIPNISQDKLTIRGLSNRISFLLKSLNTTFEQCFSFSEKDVEDFQDTSNTAALLLVMNEVMLRFPNISYKWLATGDNNSKFIHGIPLLPAHTWAIEEKENLSEYDTYVLPGFDNNNQDLFIIQAEKTSNLHNIRKGDYLVCQKYWSKPSVDSEFITDNLHLVFFNREVNPCIKYIRRIDDEIYIYDNLTDKPLNSIHCEFCNFYEIVGKIQQL